MGMGVLGLSGFDLTNYGSVGGFTDINATGTTSTTAIKKAVRVVTAAGAVTISATTDHVMVLNKASGAATVVNLPVGATNQEFVIKDGKGDAAANNITVTPAAGTIDGAATHVISTNYGSATYIYNGTSWSVI